MELGGTANWKDWIMAKKVYRKPVLKTTKIKLGVFGSYGGNPNDDTTKTMPVPTEVIGDLHLRME